jgi:hypothetical protein
MSDTKKPLVDEAVEARTSKNGSNELIGLKARIERFETAKSNQGKILNYLRHNANNHPKSIIEKLKTDLGGCGNYLVFHQYDNKAVRLGKASFCKKHFLCQLCAIRRGAKQVEVHMRKLETLQAQNPNLRPFLLTYTVRNGQDLKERFKHLSDSLKRLLKMRRNSLTQGSYSEFGQTLGGVYSIELTKSESGWHPHCHMVVLLEPDHQIDFPLQGAPKKHSQDEWAELSPKEKKLEKQKWVEFSLLKKDSGLSKEWQKITKDSYIVDLRPIEGDPAMGFVEVFKYALKFSGLSPEDNVNAYFDLLQCNGSMPRFVGNFGLLWGVKVPKSLLDETFDDLPYLELFYKYSQGNYSLATAIKKKSKNDQQREADERAPLDEVKGEPLEVQKVKSTSIKILLAREKEKLQCNLDQLALDEKRKTQVYFDNNGDRILDLLCDPIDTAIDKATKKHFDENGNRIFFDKNGNVTGRSYL